MVVGGGGVAGVGVSPAVNCPSNTSSGQAGQEAGAVAPLILGAAAAGSHGPTLFFPFGSPRSVLRHKTESGGEQASNQTGERGRERGGERETKNEIERETLAFSSCYINKL